MNCEINSTTILTEVLPLPFTMYIVICLLWTVVTMSSSREGKVLVDWGQILLYDQDRQAWFSHDKWGPMMSLYEGDIPFLLPCLPCLPFPHPILCLHPFTPTSQTSFHPPIYMAPPSPVLPSLPLLHPCCSIPCTHTVLPSHPLTRIPSTLTANQLATSPTTWLKSCCQLTASPSVVHQTNLFCTCADNAPGFWGSQSPPLSPF